MSNFAGTGAPTGVLLIYRLAGWCRVLDSRRSSTADNRLMSNQVVILPGLPRSLSAPDDATGDLYPDSTIDMIKILRLHGLSVAPLSTDKPDLVAHKSYDVWLPIIQFSLSTLGGASGNLLSALILDYF